MRALDRLMIEKHGSTLHVLKGHDTIVTSVAFSPHRNELASADLHGTLRIWDWLSGAPKKTLERPTGGGYQNLSYSPDGTRLLGVDFSFGDVSIWDTSSSQLVAPLSLNSGLCSGAAYSPDGRLLATGGNDGIVRIWDAVELRLVHALSAPVSGNGLSRVRFSSSGNLLASPLGADYSSVRIWDTRSWDSKDIAVGPQEICALAFSPDATEIVTGGSASVILARVADGRATVLSPRGFIVADLVVHPRGLLAVAAGDLRARVWDLATRELKLTLKGHSKAVLAVDVSPDGNYLATGSEDKTVRVWRVA